MSIAEIQEKTAPILQRHGVTEAYVFGSASRGDDRTDSDIDILVRFNTLRNLFEFVKVKLELEDALGGRRVDLVQMEALRPEFRTSIDSQKVRIV